MHIANWMESDIGGFVLTYFLTRNSRYPNYRTHITDTVVSSVVGLLGSLFLSRVHMWFEARDRGEIT